MDQLKGAGLMGTLKDGVITFPVLEQMDDGGNVITDEEGNTQVYQGWMNFSGGKYYPTGLNGELQIVLPSASAEVKAKAQRRAAADNFACRLYGVKNNISKKSVKSQRKGVKKLRFPIEKTLK